MAILKSEFSLGNGRLKEISGLSYNTSNNVLAVSNGVLLDLGTAGFSLNGASAITSVALGTSTYVSMNDILPTKGYVDQAVAGITPGIPGDATYIDFAVPSAATFIAGDIVALDGANGLIKAHSDLESGSNAVGAFLSKPTPTTARVQVDGQVDLTQSLAAYTLGDLVWVAGSASAGLVTSYTAIPSGEYAVQVGIVSGAVNPGKIVLQPRIFGQTA